MDRFARWAVSLAFPEGSRLDTDADRARVGKMDGWVSLCLNIFLFLIKGTLGLLAGSVSLIAHAFDTLSDCFTSIIVLLGFRMSERPADEEHPFGHGRMESVVGIVISVLLAVTALEVLRMSIDRLRNPVPLHVPDWIIITLASTIILKEIAARFAFGLARMIKSESLVADGRHHRSDGLSTVIVVVTLIVTHWQKLYWLDGAMGIVISITIGWTAYESIRDCISPLLGQPAPDEVFHEIDKIAREVPGVRGVHDIVVHRYGAVNVMSLHIEVPGAENAMRLHEMSDLVETKLHRRFHGHAVVHLDPLNTDHPNYDEVHQIVDDYVEHDPRIGTFHDLRLLGSGDRFKVVFDITAANARNNIDLKDIRREVRARLMERFPRVRVTVTLEPPYFRSVTGDGKIA